MLDKFYLYFNVFDVMQSPRNARRSYVQVDHHVMRCDVINVMLRCLLAERARIVHRWWTSPCLAAVPTCHSLSIPGLYSSLVLVNSRVYGLSNCLVIRYTAGHLHHVVFDIWPVHISAWSSLSNKPRRFVTTNASIRRICHVFAYVYTVEHLIFEHRPKNLKTHKA